MITDANNDFMSTIWTIGHSSRSADEFIGLLTGESIDLLADVRRFPGSRAHPQFGRDNFEAALRAAGIDYRHFEPLGGRRQDRLPDSPNTAWRVESLGAYADHLQSGESQSVLNELADLAEERRTAIMCAEAVPWRCHRRLIADALTARGWQVIDILGESHTKPHKLPDFARVENGLVTYPGGALF